MEWEDLGTHHEIRMKVPLMKPLKYVVKLVVKEDYPEKGSTVFAWRAVNPKTGQLDYSSGAPCGKGVIKDNGDGDCALTSIEELPSMVKYVPKFALNFLITSFTPSMIYGMLRKYKKYKAQDHTDIVY